MNMPVRRLAAETAWREAFGAFGAAPSWLNAARGEAFEAFAASGLPSPRAENWRWSEIHRYLNAPFPPAAGGAPEEVEALLAANPFRDMDASVMVFVNGVFDPSRSRIGAAEGVEVRPLSAAQARPDWLRPPSRDDAVSHLNMAFVTDGALIRVAPGVAAPPLIILNVSAGAGASFALRHFLRLEEGAALTLCEAQLGRGAHLASVVTSVRLEEGARLSRVQVNRKEADAIHFGNLEADIGPRARLEDLAFLAGGRFHRQQDLIDFTGEEAFARIDSACLLRGRQHADTRLLVNHLVPRCVSRETFRYVMDESARGAFQGNIHVAPHAQKSDGEMAAHGLLLGEEAEFDAKPELEIYADDVICAHGATAGALDEEQLFYLRARGVPERRARAMLISAFVAGILDEVENEDVRAALRDLAEAWLAGEPERTEPAAAPGQAAEERGGRRR